MQAWRLIFPCRFASNSKNQGLVLPVFFAVLLHFIDMKIPPPTLSGLASDFEPTVLAKFTPWSHGIRTSA